MKMYSVISMFGITIVTFLAGMECEVLMRKFQGTAKGTLPLEPSYIIEELHTDNEILCSRVCLSQRKCAAFVYRKSESGSVLADDHCHDSDKASGYSGLINTTMYGRTCQRWDKQIPHGHTHITEPENYCRSPNLDPNVWCYTTEILHRWEYCDVVKCMDARYNCRLYGRDTTPYTTRSGIKYFVRDPQVQASSSKN